MAVLCSYQMLGTKPTLTATLTCPIYPFTHSINVCSKQTTRMFPMFISSTKKKINIGCTLNGVKTPNVEGEYLQEEVKVFEPSMLKLTATVSVKSKESILGKFLGESEKKGVGFQLVSTQLDPITMKPKVSKEWVGDWYKCTTRKSNGSGSFSFEVDLEIDADFGEPGAILVRNNYNNELYVETISLGGFSHFACNSWVPPTHISKEQRIFFSNKVHISSSTLST